MVSILTLAMLVLLAAPVGALDLGAQVPAKPSGPASAVPPTEVRQGGDTIADAIAIEIPGIFTGSTVGYTDDYDEVCPYDGSVAPDVVYSITPAQDVMVALDLCHSSYDTKIYVYDQDLNLIGCNDDYYFSGPCFQYSSRLEVEVAGGATYFIIIDGYGSAAGSYQLEIGDIAPCQLDCPAGAELENEPPLQDGYVDLHNGGCGSPEFGVPLQPITQPVFCGVSGWYLGSGGEQFRDTDWFLIMTPPSGVLEIIGDAEFATYMFELGPQDCAHVGVLQNVVIGPCNSNTISIVGAPGSPVWFWVGPVTFDGPVNEYNYVLHLNLDEVVTTEGRNWSGIKALFH
jgi:hypothetical protein